LKTAPTLASVLVSEDRPSFSSRLKMAHDLANTVAYFHATGLLVKVLSDTSIVFRKRNGERELCLTNVEQARLVSHVTSSLL
jgi:hypothetical protein